MYHSSVLVIVYGTAYHGVSAAPDIYDPVRHLRRVARSSSCTIRRPLIMIYSTCDNVPHFHSL